MKTILITGCSSGFGFLSALTFARNGWQVIASVRNFTDGAKKLESIALAEKLPIIVVKIDVTKQAEITLEVSRALKKYGHIDILINNAGFGITRPVEEFEIEEIKELYDTNVYGAVRMSKAVLPSMRVRRKGRIINVSSINGRLAFGLYGAYGSSKFALEALTESLRFEVAPFGVDVVLVEPGAFETKFTENSKLSKKFASGTTAYKGLLNPLHGQGALGKMRRNIFVKKITDPQIVVDRLFAIAQLEKTKIRYVVGLDAHLYLITRKLAPDWLWEKIIHKAYKW